MSAAYLHIVKGEQVRVGQRTMPGIVTAITVDGSLSVDDQDLEDTDLKSLAVRGFTTQTVRVSVTLLGKSEAELNSQLRTIQQAFQVDRVKDASAKLVPTRIVNPHLDARRIKVVLFDGFSSADGGSNGEGEMTCTLSFREFESDVAKLQEKVRAEKKRRAKAAKEKSDGLVGNPNAAGGPNGSSTPPGPRPDTKGGQLPSLLDNLLGRGTDGAGAGSRAARDSVGAALALVGSAPAPIKADR